MNVLVLYPLKQETKRTHVIFRSMVIWLSSWSPLLLQLRSYRSTYPSPSLSKPSLHTGRGGRFKFCWVVVGLGCGLLVGTRLTPGVPMGAIGVILRSEQAGGMITSTIADCPSADRMVISTPACTLMRSCPGSTVGGVNGVGIGVLVGAMGVAVAFFPFLAGVAVV
jgi:hypothetical protein